MKKKIKQIIKIILAKKTSKESFFENNLKLNELVKEYKKIDEVYYEAQLVTGEKVLIRNHNYSDYSVFKQIFNNQEYGIILKMLQLNSSFNNKKYIIDAGANVGYTTTYFSNNLDSVKIFGVEPSDNNAEVYLKNVSNLKNNNEVKLYKRALSEVSNKFFEIERDFRDGKDWSITTKESEKGKVQGITIFDIINENKLEYISLLKIDIEGAERFLFKQENDLSFLKITQILALEIHDEFDIRDEIYRILKQNNFFIFESGELTVGINKVFL